jgi:very-short-patch-repair endonuclease
MARPRTKGDGLCGEVLNENDQSIISRRTMVERARKLRTRMTSAEVKLWERLQDKKLSGLKFYKQAPIDRFIVDFYCPKKKLVIELDGGIHNDPEQKDYDDVREEMLLNREIRVIRFRNEKVFDDIDDVCICIEEACFVKH